MGNDLRNPNMQRINNRELALQFIDEQIKEIKAQVGNKKVLLALSGGVDSSVVAASFFVSSSLLEPLEQLQNKSGKSNRKTGSVRFVFIFIGHLLIAIEIL